MKSWSYEKSPYVFDGQVLVQEMEDGNHMVVSSLKQHAHGIGPLVAAAPDMFAALQAINDELNGNHFSEETWQLMQKALEKAQGVQT